MKKQFIQSMLGAFICLCIGCQSKEQYDLLITNTTVIDAANGSRSDLTVGIKGNKIVNVSSNVNATGEKIIDGSDLFLIPGLWDAHLHLIFQKNLIPAYFRLLLANGITSVRDTGGQLDEVLPLKKQAQSDPKKYPRVKIAGPLLDGEPRVYDGSSPFRPNLGISLSDSAEVVRIINDYIEKGVDLLKAYELLSPEIFKIIAQQAKFHNVNLAGHIPLSLDAQMVAPYLNSIEHMRNVELSCAANADELLVQRRKMMAEMKANGSSGYLIRSKLHQNQRIPAILNKDPAQTQKVIDVLAENNVYQIPTLALIQSGSLRLYADENWKHHWKYMPEEARNEWIKSSAVFAEQGIDSNRIIFGNWGKEMVAEFKKANVPMMAGTDAPIFFLTPGFSLHKELEVLVDAGLTPMEAIEAATLNPAKYFHMEDSLGTISEGKIADLLLLNKNPLDNIKHTTSIHSVIKDGALYERDVLDAMLEN